MTRVQWSLLLLLNSTRQMKILGVILAKLKVSTVMLICLLRIMLWYCCLYHTTFTDMFASILSRCVNKCEQIFSSDFGWSHAYPMKTKGGGHMMHCPSCFRVRVFHPSWLWMAQRIRPLAIQDAGYERKITEPFSPWQNAAERKIKELKKGISRKLLLTNMPRRLWDDCLEYKAYIRSHTTHDI